MHDKQELLNLLPKESYVFVATQPPERRIGIVKVFESGFYPARLDTSRFTRNECEAFVRELNRDAGVSPAQAAAMAQGSLWGWHVKAADPRLYESEPYAQLLALY